MSSGSSSSPPSVSMRSSSSAKSSRTVNTSGSESISKPLSALISTLFEIDVPMKVWSIVNMISSVSQFPGVIFPVVLVTGPPA